MKYLNTYRLFESDEMITTESEEPSYNIDDLNDRFLELQDEGYEITIGRTIQDRPVDFKGRKMIPHSEIDNHLQKRKWWVGEDKSTLIEIDIRPPKRKRSIYRDGEVVGARTLDGIIDIEKVQDLIESSVDMMDADGYRVDCYMIDSISQDGGTGINSGNYFSDLDTIKELTKDGVTRIYVYFIKKEDDK